ncbi:hypothetical protein [Ruegeria sp. HKCCSP335]|uniref:hypothetical protein n=1 Tax=Ruegeria sp. HKCCSP335 TaxID=2794833 RepID=UPI001AE5C771|nr:hypothetical protein [Ruegeria sp. HKCCSP335]
MRRTMDWNDIAGSIGFEVGYQHQTLIATVTEILERIPEIRRPAGLRFYIEGHGLQVDHDPVDDEVQAIIDEVVRKGSELDPGAHAVFNATISATGEMRDGRAIMKLELPFKKETLVFETNPEFDPQDFLEDALVAIKKATE